MEFLNTTSGQILLIIFLAINLMAFLIMAYDKRRAVQGHNYDRTPEVFIFFLAAMFGSIGAYIGMKTFRHKTRKWYFQVGIPMLMIQNVATLYVAWQLITAV